MKKLLNVFICLTLLFALAGCSKETKVNANALDKLEASIQKLSEIDSMSYKMDITEATTKTDLTITGEMMQTNGIAFSLVADMSTEEAPLQRLIEFYIKENNLYFSVIGIKQKQAMSESDLTTSTNTPKDFKINKEDAEKFLEEASLDGDQVTLKFKTDDLNKQLKNTTSLEAEAFGSLDSITSTTLTIQFENDFITSAVFDITGKQAEKDIQVNLKASVKDINNTNRVTFPDDLDTYPEGNASDYL